MREMEVLFDHVLRFLEEEPGLEPQDILVMAPDMDQYAPFVEAVFSAPRHDGTYLPYSVAHKEIRTNSPGINAFLEILDLCQGRFDAVAVLDLAGSPPVSQKFEFFETDLEILVKWVAETRIFWGADENSRQAMDLPGMEDNTWKSGMDRLLLGYAMSGNQEDFFEGISPFDDLAVEDAPLLGRFSGFLSSLFAIAQKVTQVHTVQEWSLILEEICHQFLDPETPDLGILRVAFSKLAKAESEHHFSGQVSLAVVKAGLMSLLEKSVPSASIFRRGINFCSLAQGAGIPSSVICLVGMEDGAFPRQEGGLGFDHLTKFPKPGDRSPRGDDRFAFLLSILNAGQVLHISYVGQGIQDNAPLCPSPLVSELMDYVDSNYSLPEEGTPLVTVHKLQSFSPDYFSGKASGLFSYSHQFCQAAKTLQQGKQTFRPFFSHPLPLPEDMERSVGLETLRGFFRLPSRFILQNRLGIVLDEQSQVLETAESFDLTGLDRHMMKSLMVERTVEGGMPQDIFPMAKARGQLPHGNVGTYAFSQLVEQTSSFAKKITGFLDRADQRIDGELNIGGFQVRGRLSPVGPQGLFLFRAASVKAFDRLHAWIHHLFLCLAKPDAELQTLFAGMNGMFHYPWIPPDEAEEYFSSLLRIFTRGWEVPVPFFPETSHAYAEAFAGTDNPAKALGKARSEWEPGFNSQGDSANPYNHLCFDGQPPFTQEFKETAVAVFGPLLSHKKKGEW